MIMGTGELSLHPKDLKRYSLQEFLWRLEGARKVSNMLYKDRWEQTREVCFMIAQMSGKQAKSSLTKFHVMQFSWDEIKPKKSLSQMDKEERKEYIKALVEDSNAVWAKYRKN